MRFSDAHPALRFPKFWTNDTDIPDGGIYATSYFACALQNFPEYDPNFPSLWQRFLPGDTVVVVARGPDLLPRINDAFGRINLVAKIVGSMTMEDPAGPYEIVITSVSGKAEGVPHER